MRSHRSGCSPGGNLCEPSFLVQPQNWHEPPAGHEEQMHHGRDAHVSLRLQTSEPNPAPLALLHFSSTFLMLKVEVKINK